MTPHNIRKGLLSLVVAMASAVTACGDDGSEQTGTTVDDTAAPAAEGSAVFAAECAACHGSDGEGGNIGPSLVDRDDPGVVEEQVREGGGGMPAFEGELSDDEIAAVVQYVTEEVAG